MMLQHILIRCRDIVQRCQARCRSGGVEALEQRGSAQILNFVAIALRRLRLLRLSVGNGEWDPWLILSDASFS